MWHQGMLTSSSGLREDEEDGGGNTEDLDLPVNLKDLPIKIDWNGELPANISVPRVELHSLVLDFAAVSFLDISALKGLKTVRVVSPGCSTQECVEHPLHTAMYHCRYNKEVHRSKCQALTIARIARIRRYKMLSTIFKCKDIQHTISAYIKCQDVQHAKYVPGVWGGIRGEAMQSLDELWTYASVVVFVVV